MLLLVPGAGAAQAPTAVRAWQVVSARMVADLTAADGGADVIMHYVVRAADGGPLPLSTPIEIDVLGFGDADVPRVTVWGTTPVDLWETVGTHRAAAIEPPASAADEALLLELSYRVENAVERDSGALRARIPVVSGPTAPAPDGRFEARVLLPPGWQLREGFPSGLRAAGAEGVWRVTLPVVPAMVGFRGRSDGKVGPGVPLMIDLLTLGLLFGFAFVGWRHLRGVARTARAADA